MISTTIAFVVGLLLGIAVDTRARKERDQRIQDLEKELDFSRQYNQPPVRIDDEALEHAIRSFDEVADNFEEQ